jgi:hypothetical protein
VRLLHAFRWPLHRGGRLGHRPDAGACVGARRSLRRKRRRRKQRKRSVPSCLPTLRVELTFCGFRSTRSRSVPTPKGARSLTNTQTFFRRYQLRKLKVEAVISARGLNKNYRVEIIASKKI